jgi:oligopeptide/dipeptide ABC transporter ATP-binding protein
MTAPLLELRDVKKHFPVAAGMFATRASVRAVDGVSLAIAPGETFALVGESGCGKTTIAKLVLLLEPLTAGAILFDGTDLATANAAQRKSYRRQAQAVFQDPYSSFNPRLKIGTIIAEPILAHQRPGRTALRARVAELLDIVGLPAGAAELYPHEFSGGQRQRIAIARGLAINPRFMVLDEPISALDVSIRAQVLNLLADIQQRFGLTYLIIAHDLALVEHFSNTVAVMYLGAIVESGPTEAVFADPAHPYTRALLASVPRPDPDHRPQAGVIHGEIASALAPPPGCKFHPRCPLAIDRCRHDVPAVTQLSTGPGATSHWAACHLIGA